MGTVLYSACAAERASEADISIQALYDYKKSRRVIQKDSIRISIQALYDYKQVKKEDIEALKAFQFKHCTIISFICVLTKNTVYLISIQALYDYKFLKIKFHNLDAIFQFKHCTIIRYVKNGRSMHIGYFNSSIVRL